ncbi:glycine betaine ABC transporter substrate-binding protein [Nonomuraea roseoviolacea]|uniref:Osmoprotectant transport system substrate-binding protein n=1 Tax=Nonomuraea roseoviolacea subsp. carminata TaxID=160689 RepID=A0ABT1K4T2_9ACTN|nr:glycine betaine ABC transporter substrate-binding protein [Nonomuraea roseoviolacea]MCP2349021.1 osmoprotectant transport system substrate-binding protein [Nonomuraea roseoviolacea subsp. carminata]
MFKPLALAAGALLVLSACGSASREAAPAAAGGAPLDGVKLVIGAKDFAEQNILAHLTADLLQAAGATVETKEIKGSANTRKALEAGEIQLYWEYTGTAWITYLGNDEPIVDAARQYDAVAKADKEKNGITWLPAAPFNNTYALALSDEKAAELGVTKLSDLAKVPPAQATICVESEFAARNDGLPGLLKAYGVNVPKDNVKLLDTGVIYTETDKGQTCTFGEVFTTDGRVKALGLTALQDDKKFFPVYQGAPTVKTDTLAKSPKIAEVLAPLTRKLTTEVMQDLNAQVDVDGEDPSDVAQDWLDKEGLLK